MKVILASASPRRKELLKKLFPEFLIMPADIEEVLPDDIGSEFAPVFLAAQKADVITEKFPEYLVISADTVVISEGEILGKPKNEADAKETLRKLSGKTHKVVTGCCISLGEKCTCFSEESLVTFYDLTDAEISDYVDSGEPMGKAGSYAIQEMGGLFVEKIEGDYWNIVGLPVARLKREIKALLEET